MSIERQPSTKPINYNNQQHQLNAMLTDKEHERNTGLYIAARPERSPEPYFKEKPKGKQAPKSYTSRKLNIRSHLKGTNQNYSTSTAYTAKHRFTDTADKLKKPRTKRAPLEIKYYIITDVLKQKTNINIGDLIKIAPALRRKLINGYRPKRVTSKNSLPQPIPQPMQAEAREETMALIEDEKISTAAAYTKVSTDNMNIKALVGCDVARTCMSKALVNALGLEIDIVSESVFTLGNGTKQPALGVIYDAPIEIKENMVMPCAAEVLSSYPSPLFLGNNWLNLSNARIDFNSAKLRVTYKNQIAKLYINAIRRNAAIPKEEIHFKDDSAEESERDLEEEFEKEELLLVLEDVPKEKVAITSFKEVHIIQASKTGVTLLPNPSKSIILIRYEKESSHWVYYLDTTHPKLNLALGYFDPYSSLTVDKRAIDIRFFNRTNVEIYFNPKEVVAVLEKFNLNKDTVVSAYSLQPQPEICFMETGKQAFEQIDDDDEQTLQIEELFENLEVSNLPDILKGLKLLLKDYRRNVSYIFGTTENSCRQKYSAD
ncbi:hypothetical protein RMATCC62417_10912 [Rhizopus microsporus]|nr:hypothetical protein RMATCC62417_10912 [Rhizopus microsporus]